jgi:hypothetical protein
MAIPCATVSAVASPEADPPRLEQAWEGALRAARERPSFALYLLALLLFPFKWLSPFSHEQAGWIDILVAAAVITWSWEQIRAHARFRLRAPHWFGAAYVALGALSALLASSDRATGAQGVVIMVELAALALLSSDFARVPERRSAIVLAILAVALITGVQVAIGLALFYAGVDTSLIHGWLTSRSNAYARMSAGFYSAPLLGSFCIFASALLAREDSGVPRSWRRAGQVALAFAVLFTFSRAIIAFGLALILRAAHRRGTARARAAAAVAAVLAVSTVVGLTVTRVALDPSKPLSTKVTVPLKENANDRLQEARTAFHTFVKHPVLGSGPDSYPARFQGIPFRAHLTPLNIAATMGLPALAALIGLIAALWGERRRPTDMTIWSGLAGLGVDAIGQDVEHFRHIWIMLGLADADRHKQDP